MQGSFVALITPFKPNHTIDAKALEKLVDWHIEQGTDGLVCCGTTGEAPALTDQEKCRVAEICIKTAAKRIPILVGTGMSGTRQSALLSEKMLKLGADGGLVVTPYYNKPSQRGMIAHFQEVAKTGLPIVLYNNPGRAVVKLFPETIAEVALIPGIIGIKESSHDVELVRSLRKLSPIPIFCGEDDLTVDLIREGAIGAISVIGNVIPKGWKQMVKLALEQDWEGAQALLDCFLPLAKALFLETNPQGVKFAMEQVSLVKGTLRLPLVEVLQETQDVIRSAIENIQHCFSTRNQ